MNRYRTFPGITQVFLVCLFALLWPFTKAVGQIPTELDKEPITHTVGTDWVSTGTTVYNFSPVVDAYGNHIKIKISPSPIKDMELKEGFPDELLVLDADNRVHLITIGIDHGGPAFGKRLNDSLIGQLGTPGSETWQKVIGDAIYAFAAHALSVSRDGGSSWHSDISGIGISYIYDIAMDTAQYIYAGGVNGISKQAPDSSVWHHLDSYPGGTIFHIFIDRRNRIFAWGSSGSPYLSTDGGTTWALDNSGITGIVSFGTMGDDSFGNLYATVGSGSQRHLYKSDGGTGPWNDIESGLLDVTHRLPVINAVSGDSILRAGTNFGLFSSSDQGTTWYDDNTGITARTFYGFAKTPSGRFVASTSTGISYENAGDTIWHKTYPDSGFQDNLPIISSHSGTLYTIDPYLATNGRPYILKSSDNGSTWNPDTTGMSSVYAGQLYVDENGTEHGYNTNYSVFLYSKQQGGTWIADTSGFDPSYSQYVYAVASDGKGNLFASGQMNKATIWRRPINGTAWIPDTLGLDTALAAANSQGWNSFTSMAAGADGNMIGSTRYALLRRSGGVWSHIPFPSNLFAHYTVADRVSIDSTGALFVAFSSLLLNTPASGVYFTKDLGANWYLAGLDSLTVTGLISYDSTTYALSSEGITALTGKIPRPLTSVVVFADSGWQMISLPKNVNDASVSKLFPTALGSQAYKYKSGYIRQDSLVPGLGYWAKFPAPWVGSLYGYSYPTVNVPVDSGWNMVGSTDQNVPIPTGEIIGSNFYLYLAGYQSTSTLWSGYGFWVKTTHAGTITLGGTSLKPATQHAEENAVKELNSITITDAHRHSQTLYFGASSKYLDPTRFEMPPKPPAGMFDARFTSQRMLETASQIGAQHFPIQISEAAYPVSVAWHMSARQQGTATLSIGGKERTISGSGSATIENTGSTLIISLADAHSTELPRTFALKQNYPNPFNPSTTIGYDLAEDARVRLTVYNTLGQEVAHLVDAAQAAGSYNIRFEGSNLSSGVYFYRLDATPIGEKGMQITFNKKLLLLK